MAREEKKYRNQKISVLNWMGTLLLCAIPGVNILSMILFIILAKTQAKRSFAIAMLVLSVILAALVCAAFLVFPNELADLANQIRRQAGLTAQISLN